MALKLNVSGMEIYLDIRDYVESNSENWHSKWCQVDYAFRFPGCIDYQKNDDEILLSYEVENLEKYLTKLLEDRLTQKELLKFCEPDFNFRLYPNCLVTDQNPNVTYVAPGHENLDIWVDWIVNLWSDGGLTGNCFSMSLGREAITQLRDYLRTVMEK